MRHWLARTGIVVWLALLPAIAAAQDKPAFVVLPGAWGGAWMLKPLEQALRARGYEVYRPSLVGTGETVHLASRDITLETHVKQVVNLVLYEDLRDVVLVGWSYSGMVITGVADRIPERLRRLVYVDAFVPLDGESAMDVADRLIDRSPSLARFKAGILAHRVDGMVPAFWQPKDRPPPRQDPQPAATIFEPIRLSSRAPARVPGAFVQFVPEGSPAGSADFESSAVRARERGWPVVVVEGEHDAVVTRGVEIAAIVERLGVAPVASRP